MDFKNKVCIVTGAASGIGRATAETLAKCGAKLSLMDIRENKCKLLSVLRISKGRFLVEGLIYC